MEMQLNLFIYGFILKKKKNSLQGKKMPLVVETGLSLLPGCQLNAPHCHCK